MSVHHEGNVTVALPWGLGEGTGTATASLSASCPCSSPRSADRALGRPGPKRLETLLCSYSAIFRNL